jgi:hypothetical protein
LRGWRGRQTSFDHCEGYVREREKNSRLDLMMIQQVYRACLRSLGRRIGYGVAKLARLWIVQSSCNIAYASRDSCHTVLAALGQGTGTAGKAGQPLPFPISLLNNPSLGGRQQNFPDNLRYLCCNTGKVGNTLNQPMPSNGWLAFLKVRHLPTIYSSARYGGQCFLVQLLACW